MYANARRTCLICISTVLILACNRAQAQDAQPQPPKNLFERLQSEGFELRRDITGPDHDEAATFSLVDTIGKGTVSSADFALSWRQPKKTGRTRSPLRLSAEGHVSSDNSTSEDAWRLRATTEYDVAFRPTGGYYLSLSLKHESDRDFKTRKIMGELLFTPTFDKLGIGAFQPPFQGGRPAPVARYRFRPFLGLDAGGTLARGNSNETESTVLRLLVRGKFELIFPRLQQSLGLTTILIFIDDSLYHLPLENMDSRHNLFVAGLQLQLSDSIGVAVTYKIGEASPTFMRTKSLTAGLDVKF